MHYNYPCSFQYTETPGIQDKTLVYYSLIFVNISCIAAYLSQKRQRRDASSQTLNCYKGTILPADSSPSVKVPPDVTINGLSKNVWTDDDVTFNCTVVSNLAANVTWLFNDVSLAEKRDYRHSYLNCGMVLHIKKVLGRDAGKYTCVVQNEIGRAMASSHLTVISSKLSSSLKGIRDRRRDSNTVKPRKYVHQRDYKNCPH